MSPASLDLSRAAVDARLMSEPGVYGLAATLATVEHWVFDRTGLTPDELRSREGKISSASDVLEQLSEKLDASEDLIGFIVSLSSRRRFVLLWFFEESRPALVQELAQYAFRHRHQSPNCAHYVHWLDIIAKSELISRIFSEENTQAVCRVLAAWKH